MASVGRGYTRALDLAPNAPPIRQPTGHAFAVTWSSTMKHIGQAANRTVATERGKFTEGVWQEELLEAQVISGMRVHRFFYAPGSHSHWHSHTGEQALLFVAGRARIRKVGEPPFEVGPGDLVYVAPGDKHWHGAVANQFLVHYAFTASGKTDWFEEVTEAEYAG